MATTTNRLVRARKTRSQIARTFTALDNRETTVNIVLRDPPRCLRRIRVYDVLRRVPHLDKKGAEKVLRLAKVWPLKTMGSLTEEEVTAIIRNLPPRARV